MNTRGFWKKPLCVALHTSLDGARSYAEDGKPTERDAEFSGFGRSMGLLLTWGRGGAV